MKDSSKTIRELVAEISVLKKRNQKLEYSEAESKLAEEALRKSEKKYNKLAHFLPQIVFEADIKGNITFVNQAAYPLSGYSPEDFKGGLNVLQMLVPEDRDRARSNMQRILLGEELGESNIPS